jgi:hypothetical protein
MPCGSVLPLECTALIECSEIYILSGARVYVVYMPTRHNMATFQLYLDKALHISYVETCQRFQGGITFAQNVGDVIRLMDFLNVSSRLTSCISSWLFSSATM